MRGYEILKKDNVLRLVLAILTCIINILDILVFKTNVIRYMCFGVYVTLILENTFIIYNLYFNDSNEEVNKKGKR